MNDRDVAPARQQQPNDTRGEPAEDEAVTAEEQRQGRSLDDRLAEETPDRPTRSEDVPPGELVDEDRPDTEGELVSAMAEADPDELTAETDDVVETVEEEGPAAEELAVDVRDSAPGGTDDESDGYVREEGGRSAE